MRAWGSRVGLLALALAASCGTSVQGSSGGTTSSASSSSGAARACVAGTQINCGCPGGELPGTQVCASDGSGFGPCACGGNGGSSASSSSATSTSSTTSSTSSTTSGGTGGGPVDAGSDGPPGSVAPNQIPGLSLWLDSSVGKTVLAQCPLRVQVWADQSSHGNNAKYSDLCGNEPGPSIELSGYKSFDVVDYVLNGSSAISSIDDDASLQFGTGPFAVAFVLDATIPPPTAAIWSKDQTNGLNIVLDENVHVTTPSASAEALYTTSAWHVMLVRGPALEIRVDGVPTAGTTSTSDVSAPTVPIWVGVLGGGNENATLRYLQIVAYKGAVSDADAAGLEAYFKAKYGF